MDNNNSLNIKIEGDIDGTPLTPKTCDIKYIIPILEGADKIFSIRDQDSNYILTHEINEGSVINRFSANTNLIKMVTSALLIVQSTGCLNDLTPKQQKGIVILEKLAKRKNVRINISSEAENQLNLRIDNSTNFEQAGIMVNSELYLYGTIVDAGGKNNPNIHLDTGDVTYRIKTTEDYLKGLKTNLLYKTYGIRVSCQQNLLNNEIDENSIQLIELVNYAPGYVDGDLDKYIEKATETWKDVNIEEFLNDIRDTYED